MTKFSLVFTFILFYVITASAQKNYEREHRILRSQFPEKALGYVQEKMGDAKRIKFYKEIDSAKVSYEAKFKKDRLWYGMEFDTEGSLEEIEFMIKPVDIPDDSFTKINAYLDQRFKKRRVRRMYQKYPVSMEESTETTVSNAFQNLLLPSIKYEFIVSGKKESTYEQYEFLFDAEGNFEKMRKSLPPNYDHVLY